MKEKEQDKKEKKIPRIKWIIGRLWQCRKVVVISLIIRALDTIDRCSRTWAGKLRMGTILN